MTCSYGNDNILQRTHGHEPGICSCTTVKAERNESIASNQSESSRMLEKWRKSQCLIDFAARLVGCRHKNVVREGFGGASEKITRETQERKRQSVRGRLDLVVFA